VSARMAGKSGFAMKNYTQMNDEVEQIDGELGEMLAKARKDIEALEWDTKKVALPKHQRDAEVSRIKSVLDSARSVHQVIPSQKMHLRCPTNCIFVPMSWQCRPLSGGCCCWCGPHMMASHMPQFSARDQGEGERVSGRGWEMVSLLPAEELHIHICVCIHACACDSSRVCGESLTVSPVAAELEGGAQRSGQGEPLPVRAQSKGTHEGH